MAKWIERLQQTDEGRQLIEQERVLMETTETIASLLHEQGVSRTELARRIKKSPAFVTKLLRGDNNFTLRTLSNVFYALNRSMHISLGDIGEDISLCSTQTTQPLRLDSSSWIFKQTTWNTNSMTGRQASDNPGDVAA